LPPPKVLLPGFFGPKFWVLIGAQRSYETRALEMAFSSVMMRLKTPRFYNFAQAIGWRVRKFLGNTDLLPNYVTGCPSCFHDQGLKLLASKTSIEMKGACPNCGSNGNKKLRMSELQYILHTFFIWGTYQKPTYGAYPAIQANEHQTTSVKFSDWLEPDVRLFEKWFGIGFFHYGPRFWMFGQVTPLEHLQDINMRSDVIARILVGYPVVDLPIDTIIYRIRKHPSDPGEPSEYDSPPIEMAGKGRLDSVGFPVMYASSDLQICIHECRIAAEDEIYVASLTPKRALRLLDLTNILTEEGVTEFESLDLAVHMLFLAGAHSYEITRAIAKRAHLAGFDGLIYPSFFSLLRTGTMPLMTTYGISHRRIEMMHDSERSKMVPNVAIFGRPIADGVLAARSLNRLMINSVEYHVHFGPVKFD